MGVLINSKHVSLKVNLDRWCDRHRVINGGKDYLVNKQCGLEKLQNGTVPSQEVA